MPRRANPMSSGAIARGPMRPTGDDGRRIDPGLLLELFGQTPIVFNRIYLDITGSVTAAMWLAYAVYHVCERQRRPGDWMVRSQAEWCRETGLSRREQENARKRLRHLGVLVEKRSPNAPLAYRIDMERLYALMDHHARQINAAHLAARGQPSGQPSRQPCAGAASARLQPGY